MFESDYNHGFKLTFENGYTVSVQFGGGNYCSRRGEGQGDFRADQRRAIVKSRTAEVLVSGPDGDVRLPGDDGHGCLGWQTADKVAIVIAYVSQPQFDPSALALALAVSA